jgi:hypothetical protein
MRGSTVGRHSEQPSVSPEEFDRYDAELTANAVPQTADERIEALSQIREDLAADKRRMEGWPR